jgi:peptidoglycan hydrolase CwlO-like protein
MIDPVVGIIVAAAIASLGTYLVAARRLSGKVGSSEAAELWEESRSIRKWGGERIAELNRVVEKLETRVGFVETQNNDLAKENSNLVQQIRDLSSTITELRAEIVALTLELKKSHERVAELEDEADESRE